MNDLERLATATDGQSKASMQDRYRDEVIEFIAHDIAESLLEDGKAAYWYIRETEADSLRQFSWPQLVAELNSRFAGNEDDFTITDLGGIP